MTLKSEVVITENISTVILKRVGTSLKKIKVTLWWQNYLALK